MKGTFTLVMLVFAFAGASPSGASVWTEIPLPPRVASFNAMAVGTTHVFAAMRDSSDNDLGLFRTPIGSPGTWEPLGLATARDMIVAGDQDQYLLVRQYGAPKIVYSSDGGLTWVPRDAGIPQLYAISLGWNGHYPGTVYAGATDNYENVGTYASDDFGATWRYWEICDYGITRGMYEIDSRQMGGPSAWALDYTGYFEDLLWKTDDGGRSWVSYGLGEGWGILNLAASQREDRSVYLLTQNRVLRSTDGVVQQFGSPPFADRTNVAIESPLWDPDRVYAAGLTPGDNYLSVAFASDPLTDWTTIREGLPDRQSPDPLWDTWRFQLVAAPGRPLLFFSSWGLGLWMRDMTDVAGVESQASTIRLLLSCPMPNPASRAVEFIVAGKASADVTILDALGRVVRRLGEVSGRHTWDGFLDSGRPAPAGVFYVRASGESGTSTRRITLVR